MRILALGDLPVAEDTRRLAAALALPGETFFPGFAFSSPTAATMVRLEDREETCFVRASWPYVLTTFVVLVFLMTAPVLARRFAGDLVPRAAFFALPAMLETPFFRAVAAPLAAPLAALRLALDSDRLTPVAGSDSVAPIPEHPAPGW